MRKIKLILMFSCLTLLFSAINAKAQNQRVAFKRGASSATVAGKIAASGSKTFVVGARAGQMIRATIKSPGKAVRFQEGESATGLSWITKTVGGDNFIYIQNNSSRATSFTITISIK